MNVVFDLDGTLTNPVVGITRGMAATVHSFGRPEPPVAELAACIGPPLRETFATLLHTQDGPTIEEAVIRYRDRYDKQGWCENEVYAGVPEMLGQLRRAGCRLFVATSKLEAFAVRILGHFNLAAHFNAIYGATPDGRLDDKADLVALLLTREKLIVGDTTMVGDRRHDVLAARQNGIRPVGVSYGFGSADELAQAGATAICATPAAVVGEILRGQSPGQRR